MKIGYVYCMKSDSIPDYVKVGFTQNINERIKSLSTGIPHNYICEFYIKVNNPQKIQKKYS